MADNLFEIKNLSFSYDKDKVIDDLSLTIKPGGVTTIIGANGCGKSTLLKIVTGNLKPDVGRVEVAEKELSSFHTNEMARQVAFLPQVHEIPKDMTAEELVSCGRYPYQHWWTGVSTHDRDVIRSAMQRTNTLHLKDRLAANLSGGERQRIWIAMALAQEPKILILDEPTTYLDICHQLEVLELVSKLNREENITIIMVLHDINQAVRYSSEIFVLENGIIERQGTPIDVMTHDAIADIFEVDADVEMRRGRPSISINGLLD